jgi:hypothetical protein
MASKWSRYANNTKLNPFYTMYKNITNLEYGEYIRVSTKNTAKMRELQEKEIRPQPSCQVLGAASTRGEEEEVERLEQHQQNQEQVQHEDEIRHLIVNLSQEFYRYVHTIYFHVGLLHIFILKGQRQEIFRLRFPDFIA